MARCTGAPLGRSVEYRNLSLYRVTPDYPANTALHPYSNGLGPRAASANALLTQHYRASPSYDSNAVMDPYTSHLGLPRKAIRAT
jgi:hypothetical protein